jgi:hypothetical protein
MTEALHLVEDVLRDLSFEDVAADVSDALACLRMRDLYSRSGRQECGYVEPADAAIDMIDEVLDPFILTIERHASTQRREAALVVCCGVMLGLYRAERCEPRSEVLGLMPDGLADFADRAITALGRARRRRDGRAPLPKELVAFAKEHLPEWDWLQR